MNKFLKLWLPVFVWCGVIFSLSAIPSLHVNHGIAYFILRKLAHVTEYFILTFLLYRALEESFNLKYFYLFICTLGLSVLFAVSDEFHQLFVRQRSGKPTDVLVDSLGIMLFFIWLRYKKELISRKIKPKA